MATASRSAPRPFISESPRISEPALRIPSCAPDPSVVDWSCGPLPAPPPPLEPVVPVTNAAAQALDEMNPANLAAFLRDYLLDRAQSSGDVEDASDEAGDVDLFVVGDREITVSSPLPNYGDGDLAAR